MWGVQSSARVYLCLGNTDMRNYAELHVMRSTHGAD